MKPYLKFGLIYAGAAIAYSLLTFGLGMEKDPSVQSAGQWFNIALPAVVIFLGIRERRNVTGNGYLSFGNGFGTGMGIAFIGGVISSVYTYLYFTILNPGMITWIKMRQEEEMIKRGMSDSEVEAFAGQMDTWSSPGMMSAFVVIGAILLGLVISLISSAILKKENPNEMV
jgi:hypothetical protein